MNTILNFIQKDKIGEPPWNYYFLQNLEEKEYPLYLAKLFKLNTGENLPLKYDFKQQARVIDKKRCKTFNQKIQWIKLYGVTDLMRKCTDKVAVRDYVKEKIGEEYLKPVLQIIGENPLSQTLSRERGEFANPSADIPSLGRGLGRGLNNDVSTYFDQIQWDKLPNAFVIKCNHGCKWQYIIKNKEQFLSTPQLFEIVKKNITGWLEQDYSFYGSFEMQYMTSCTWKLHNNNLCTEKQDKFYEKGIEPMILIEPLLMKKTDNEVDKVQVYCFNGKIKYIITLLKELNVIIYDENLNISEDLFDIKSKKFCLSNNNIKNVFENLIKQAIDLSKKLSIYKSTLSKSQAVFPFVRIDWMIYQNKLYFEEITFTPYSGCVKFKKKYNLKLGEFIQLERNSNEF